VLPIACTLSPDSLSDRTAWIAVLNSRFLRESRLEGNTLQLTYDAAAASRVRDLVSKERACCSFLRFAIEESVSSIELRIDAPDVDEMGVAPLFAPFLSGA
jgi:hypothetical protein